MQGCMSARLILYTYICYTCQTHSCTLYIHICAMYGIEVWKCFGYKQKLNGIQFSASLHYRAYSHYSANAGQESCHLAVMRSRFKKLTDSNKFENFYSKAK